MASARPDHEPGSPKVKPGEDLASHQVAAGLAVIIVGAGGLRWYVVGPLMLVMSVYCWLNANSPSLSRKMLGASIVAAILVLVVGCVPTENGCRHAYDERVSSTTCRHQTSDGWVYHSD